MSKIALAQQPSDSVIRQALSCVLQVWHTSRARSLSGRHKQCPVPKRDPETRVLRGSLLFSVNPVLTVAGSVALSTAPSRRYHRIDSGEGGFFFSRRKRDDRSGWTVRTTSACPLTADARLPKRGPPQCKRHMYGAATPVEQGTDMPYGGRGYR